ncbi:SZT2 isoform X1 [Labeo rohita]|uniref:SZT2 isoform X1 n=1 Tax=Labeo rohita TaxID=84645 RepID=A0A498NYQ7_LABRO|nr:SZT2 isoform X1 [Labeo rohita]
MILGQFFLRHAVQLEEGDTGTLQAVYQTTYLPWVTFMNRLGIACIALSFVDAKGSALQVPAQDGSGPPLRGDVSSISLQPDQFEALTTVIKVDSSSQSSGAAVRVRFDVWEQGNISPMQLTDRLRAALRHALCDVIMEMRVLPNPLCLDTFCLPVAVQRDESTGEQWMHM